MDYTFTVNNSELSYMHEVSEEAMELYNNFKDAYNKDLYHSIAAVLDNTQKTHPQITNEELKELYYTKYKSKRSIISESKEALFEIIDHVYFRLEKKRL